MSTEGKKFSDFQQSECKDEPKKRTSKRDVCPTCVPDPNWQSEKPWFQMTEAWLDKKNCTYNYTYNLKRLSDVEYPSAADKPFMAPFPKLNDQQRSKITSTSIVEILNKFGKKNTTEAVSDLRRAAYIDIYVSPGKDIYKQLISIPAYNVDILEDDPLGKDEDENETSDESISEIELDAATLYEKIHRIRMALKTYEFYYSAFNKVQQAIIHQEGNPLKKIDFNKVRRLLDTFLIDLNDALSDNGFEKLRLIPRSSFGVLKAPLTIKMTLQDKESNPFHVKSVEVSATNGCDEYQELANIKKIQSADKRHIMPWLSKIDEIDNDVRAQKTKPWLEFTLEYFWPKMVVDYGTDLGDMNAEQKDALACLLEKDLGIGRGRPLDALLDTILSAADLFSYEQAKKGCKPTKDIKTDSIQAQKDKRYQDDLNYKDYRKVEMIKRLTTSKYNSIINNYTGVVIEEAGKSMDLSVPKNPSEKQVLKWLDANKQEYGKNIILPEDQEEMFYGNSTFWTDPFKTIFEQVALRRAMAEYEKNNKDWNFHLNSPWLYDAKAAVEDERKKETTIIDVLKETSDSLQEVETFYDFISIFGVCGVNKLAGLGIKCLSGGVSINDFYDAAIMQIFKGMKLDTFEMLFAAIPQNIRRKLDLTIKQEFGNVSLTQLIGFTKKQNPSANLLFVGGDTMAEIDRTVEMMEKYPRYHKAPEQVRTQYKWAKRGNQYGGWFWGDATEGTMGLSQAGNITTTQGNLQNKYYDYGRKSYKPVSPLEEDTEGKLPEEDKQAQTKTKRNLKKAIRKRMRERDKKQLDAAKERFNSFFSPEGHQERMDAMATTTTTNIQEVEAFNEETWNAAKPPAPNFDFKFEDHFTEEELDEAYKSWRQHRRDRGETRSNNLRKVWYTYAILFGKGITIGPFGTWWKGAIKAMKDDGGYGNVEQSIKFLQKEIDAKTKEEMDAYAVILEEWEQSKSAYTMMEQITTTETSMRDLSDKEKRQAYWEGSGDVMRERLAAKRSVYGTNEYEQAVKDYKETNLGVKINKLVSAVVVETIESLIGFMPPDNLWDLLRRYPIPDMVLNILEGLLRPCPHEPLVFPAPAKFLNTLKVDVCDPTIQITWPKLVVPTLDWKSQIKERYRSEIRDEIIKLYTKSLYTIIKKMYDLLEGALCKSMEAAGGLAMGLIEGETLGDSWTDAIAEAFCGNDKEKAKKLNEQFFEDKAALAANIIGGIASTREVLEVLAYPDNQDSGFQQDVADAFADLGGDELAEYGTPSAVGEAFRNIASNLTPSERNRIREMLEEGVPNLPISEAICLTEEQLREWNDLREALLRDKGLGPANARAQVAALNELTKKALEDLLGISADLQNGGPFLGPAQDWFDPDDGTGDDGTGDAADDDDDDKSDEPGGGIDDIYDEDPPCIDNVPKQNRPDDLEKSDEEEAMDEQSESMLRFVKNSFFNKGGIFNEALRDREDKGLRGHAMRVKQRYLWPNWSNSAEEWDEKMTNAGWALNIVMTAAGSEGDGIGHIGTFPETVGGKIREQLLDNNFNINMDAKYIKVSTPNKPTNKPSIVSPEVTLDIKYVSGDTIAINNNLVLSYVNDQTENPSRRKRGYFGYNINSTFHPEGSNTFSYYSSISSKTIKEGAFSREYSTMIPSEPSDEQKKILEEIGLPYGTENYQNLRKKVFNNYINQKCATIFESRNYDNLYKFSFQQLVEGVKEAAVTDPRSDLPYGFRFGYVKDDLVDEDFDVYTGPSGEEYNYTEEERVLGKYGNDRIVVLNPEVYGGRYSNPPFWVRPMQQDGWLDASEAVFGGTEGCEPKSIGAISFKDIQNRIKNVKDSLSPDPLLSKDQDCVSRRPFNHLVLPETHAGIEGVVRTTIRLYAFEEYLKGLGVFSNFIYNEKNYDASIAGLIMNRMKMTMLDMGNPRSTRKIRIKRRNYWYTFLEQTVQTYNRMIEIDGIMPPPEVLKALEDIGDLQLNYIDPTKKIRKEYFNPDYEWVPKTVPPLYEKDNPESYDLTDVKQFYHDAIAYRLYGEDLFMTDGTTNIELSSKSWYSLKKIRFFVKIFAIRLVEQQCKIVLMELIKSELRIAAERFNTAANTPAYYTDFEKAFLGFGNIFKNSNIKLGTIDEEIVGTAPTIVQDNSVTIGEKGKAVWLIEKYLRVTDRENKENIPLYIQNRGQEYHGIMPAQRFSDFLNSVPEELLTKQDGSKLMVSDCFGDLEFTYDRSIKKVFEFMFSTTEGSTASPQLSLEELVTKLHFLNPDAVDIRMSMQNHIMGTEYGDFDVKVTKDFILPEEFARTTIVPTGTTGDLGVYHGIRISVITPKDSIYKKITAQDLLNAINQGVESGETDIVVDELVSSIRDLGEILEDSKPELVAMTADILTGGTLDTETLSEIFLNTTHGTPEEIDQSLREIGSNMGIGLGDIPAIGTWVDTSLVPIPNIEEKLSVSRNEKTFLFDDGNYAIPILSAEYELMDADIKSLKATNFDIKCLVNKMVADPAYNLIFEKVFCTKMCLSMVGAFCMFGFIPAQGYGVGERTEVDNDPGDADFFDGKHNKKIKSFLRKRFSAYYLSNDIDGQSEDNEEEQDTEFKFNNPFRGLELSMTMPKLMWYQKGKIKDNPYDANGVECADPMKDLM